MKKLVTALALCAAVSAYAQVESANVVGYVKTAATGQYFSTGPTFITVGSITDEWKLGSMSATGMDPTTDLIQFLSPVDANTELMATYIDLATATSYGNVALVGWWNLDLDTSLNDLVFPTGTAFLCNFGSSGVEFTCAGQVLTGAVTLDLSGLQYPFVANFLPKQITLGDVSATGMDPTTDLIQFLSPVDANTELMATYIDLATATSYGNVALVGWWNLDLDTSLDDTILLPGTSFLGNIGSSNVSLVFPSAL